MHLLHDQPGTLWYLRATHCRMTMLALLPMQARLQPLWAALRGQLLPLHCGCQSPSLTEKKSRWSLVASPNMSGSQTSLTMTPPSSLHPANLIHSLNCSHLLPGHPSRHPLIVHPSLSLIPLGMLSFLMCHAYSLWYSLTQPQAWTGRPQFQSWGVLHLRCKA